MNAVPKPARHPVRTISVITPSLNQGRYLDQLLKSVFAQNYPALDYWVIDGGSTDETLGILRGWGDRVHWVSEPDGGQADAINKGLARATGDVCAWLNVDDTYLPGALRWVADAFAATPEADLVYGDAVLTDDLGREIGVYRGEPFSYARLLRRNFIPQPSCFFRREAFQSEGYLDASLACSLDYEFWLRVTERRRAAYHPGRVATYRISRGGKTTSRFARMAWETAAVVRRHARGRCPAWWPAVLYIRTLLGGLLKQAPWTLRLLAWGKWR